MGYLCFPWTAYATIEEFETGPPSPAYDDPDFFLDCLGAGNERAVTWTKDGTDLPRAEFDLVESKIETGDYIFGQEKAYRKR